MQVVWQGRYDILTCRVIREGATLRAERAQDQEWIPMHPNDQASVIAFAFRGWSPEAIPIRKSLLRSAIAAIRAWAVDEEDIQEIADSLLFGEDGRDAGDGHRCQLCGSLCAGDRRHRCWA